MDWGDAFSFNSNDCNRHCNYNYNCLNRINADLNRDQSDRRQLPSFLKLR